MLLCSVHGHGRAPLEHALSASSQQISHCGCGHRGTSHHYLVCGYTQCYYEACHSQAAEHPGNQHTRSNSGAEGADCPQASSVTPRSYSRSLTLMMALKFSPPCKIFVCKSIIHPHVAAGGVSVPLADSPPCGTIVTLGLLSSQEQKKRESFGYRCASCEYSLISLAL
jgi:hypothetical protein